MYLIEEWQTNCSLTTIYDQTLVQLGWTEELFFLISKWYCISWLPCSHTHTSWIRTIAVTRNSWIYKFFNFNFDRYPGRLSDLLFFEKVTVSRTGRTIGFQNILIPTLINFRKLSLTCFFISLQRIDQTCIHFMILLLLYHFHMLQGRKEDYL